MKRLNFVFFGGEPLAVPVLDILEVAGFTPQLIICSPDKPVGRKQILTHPPVKVWANERNLPVFQPTTYKNNQNVEDILKTQSWDVFVIVAYNFILPNWLLQTPQHGSLNVHPSLLPQLRGASPIRSAILQDLKEAVGVSIILLDEAMDHGPILAQEPHPIKESNWPISGPTLDQRLAEQGGKLLADTLPRFMAGEITPQPQNHELATYCTKLQKADSELFIDPKNLPAGEAGWQTWLKINAFAGIGDTFFIHQELRIKVKQASWTDNHLQLISVVPEGKKEMSFENFLKNYAST
jgi:methionyl-tRNA formyltransferase